jgi:hypothetical protein
LATPLASISAAIELAVRQYAAIALASARRRFSRHDLIAASYRRRVAARGGYSTVHHYISLYSTVYHCIALYRCALWCRILRFSDGVGFSDGVLIRDRIIARATTGQRWSARMSSVTPQHTKCHTTTYQVLHHNIPNCPPSHHNIPSVTPQYTKCRTTRYQIKILGYCE